MYQISRKSVQWEPRCSMWTDRHKEAKTRFPQIFECTYILLTFIVFNSPFSNSEYTACNNKASNKQQTVKELVVA